MDKVIEILAELHPGVDFGAEQHLIDDGILDSLEIMSLVVALNDEFDVEIPPLEIVPENFQSAEAIFKLVTRLEDEE